MFPVIPKAREIGEYYGGGGRAGVGGGGRSGMVHHETNQPGMGVRGY
jgi:hypothetical protein